MQILNFFICYRASSTFIYPSAMTEFVKKTFFILELLLPNLNKVFNLFEV